MEVQREVESTEVLCACCGERSPTLQVGWLFSTDKRLRLTFQDNQTPEKPPLVITVMFESVEPVVSL